MSVAQDEQQGVAELLPTCQHYREDGGDHGEPTGRCFWHHEALGKTYEVECDGVVGKCDHEPDWQRQEAAAAAREDAA